MFFYHFGRNETDFFLAHDNGFVLERAFVVIRTVPTYVEMCSNTYKKIQFDGIRGKKKIALIYLAPGSGEKQRYFETEIVPRFSA